MENLWCLLGQGIHMVGQIQQNHIHLILVRINYLTVSELDGQREKEIGYRCKI